LTYQELTECYSELAAGSLSHSIAAKIYGLLQRYGQYEPFKCKVFLKGKLLDPVSEARWIPSDELAPLPAAYSHVDEANLASITDYIDNRWIRKFFFDIARVPVGLRLSDHVIALDWIANNSAIKSLTTGQIIQAVEHIYKKLRAYGSKNIAAQQPVALLRPNGSFVLLKDAIALVGHKPSKSNLEDLGEACWIETFDGAFMELFEAWGVRIVTASKEKPAPAEEPRNVVQYKALPGQYVAASATSIQMFNSVMPLWLREVLQFTLLRLGNRKPHAIDVKVKELRVVIVSALGVQLTLMPSKKPLEDVEWKEECKAFYDVSSNVLYLKQFWSASTQEKDDLFDRVILAVASAVAEKANDPNGIKDFMARVSWIKMALRACLHQFHGSKNPVSDSTKWLSKKLSFEDCGVLRL
jgi:hypothetical protein